MQPPIQVLQKDAWAQLKFEARGTLATAFKGEQFQDVYHVRGTSALRILTADGNFDYDIPIDVEVNDVPSDVSDVVSFDTFTEPAPVGRLTRVKCQAQMKR